MPDASYFCNTIAAVAFSEASNLLPAWQAPPPSPRSQRVSSLEARDMRDDHW